MSPNYFIKTRQKCAMHDLTGFRRDLLTVIAGLDDPYGLAIKDELEGYYEEEVRHGRLYPNLDTLVEKGLVEKGQQDRRTNFYRLTRRGQRELAARFNWEGQYIDVDVDTPELQATSTEQEPSGSSHR
mgnify:FL=1